MDFTPVDPEFKTKVERGFAAQPVMAAIGASLCRLEAGLVEIEMPFRADLTQQHGFLHAGMIAAIADSACGFAAYSLMPANAHVLTVEFKINLCSPARGRRFVARGQVIKPGRTLVLARGEVTAHDDDGRRLIAVIQGTMMTVAGRPDLGGFKAGS